MSKFPGFRFVNLCWIFLFWEGFVTLKWNCARRTLQQGAPDSFVVDAPPGVVVLSVLAVVLEPMISGGNKEAPRLQVIFGQEATVSSATA